jgi:uncharacterized LabA/DUF88 family protein
MSNRQAARVGVYVDVANITSNGGNGMRYDVLREFATRDGAEPIRLNAYVTYDPERERGDPSGIYRARQAGFHSRLRDFGYKVILKNYKWYLNEEGQRVAKANTDLDMAVDALLQSENMDRVILATGDGDFVRVVQALQNNGCRVEVVAFTNISSELRREADLYANGYLIPTRPAPGTRRLQATFLGTGGLASEGSVQLLRHRARIRLLPRDEGDRP